MPNHLHVLLYPTHAGTSLGQLVGPGKRFMAYDIVSSLKKLGRDDLLDTMRKGVQRTEALRDKRHRVFRLSFDARECYTEKILLEKLDYIHRNPVQGKWSLVDDFATYEHSSAGFYELGKKGLFEVTHYMDLGGD